MCVVFPATQPNSSVKMCNIIHSRLLVKLMHKCRFLLIREFATSMKDVPYEIKKLPALTHPVEADTEKSNDDMRYKKHDILKDSK